MQVRRAEFGAHGSQERRCAIHPNALGFKVCCARTASGLRIVVSMRVLGWNVVLAKAVMWFDLYCCFFVFKCEFGINPGIIAFLSMVGLYVYGCTLLYCQGFPAL